jgi:hypothetical protein
LTKYQRLCVHLSDDLSNNWERHVVDCIHL